MQEPTPLSHPCYPNQRPCKLFIMSGGEGEGELAPLVNGFLKHYALNVYKPYSQQLLVRAEFSFFSYIMKHTCWMCEINDNEVELHFQIQLKFYITENLDKKSNCIVWFQKISIPPPRGKLEIPEGWGGQWPRKFQRGGGVNGWISFQRVNFTFTSDIIVQSCNLRT